MKIYSELPPVFVSGADFLSRFLHAELRSEHGDFAAFNSALIGGVVAPPKRAYA